MSQATKRAWRRVAASLFLLPVLAEGGNHLYAQTAGGSYSTPSASRPADPKEDARQLLKQGRIYLQANDMARAKQCAILAQQKNVKWEFYEDTPEKLLTDLAAMPGSVVQPVSTVAAPTMAKAAASTAPALPPIGGQRKEAKAPSLPSDPRLLLKMGRDALKGGNLDLAKECGNKANASPTRWGLFEDTPRKLLDDVVKVRADKDRAESDKLLVESRKLLTKGDYDKAAETAHKAERLHGPYSMWDLGDRPSKVLAEVEAAKLRNRKPNLPASPTAVTSASKTAAPVAAKPEAKPIQPVSAYAPIPSTAPTAPATPAATPARQKALVLMTECRTLQRGGKLVEARGKAIEAQKLNAEYAANEDRPELVLMELNQQGVAEITRRVDEAMKLAGTQPSAASAAQAQGMLAQTRQFALGMGLDTFPVDEKVSWLNRVAAATRPATPVVVQPGSNPAAPPVLKSASNSMQGRQMLDNARMELRNGQTDSARRIAEAVFSGPYGMQNEAAALLRNIDVEEQNQKILAANRAYDAAIGALQRGEHGQAFNIFLQIDGTLLSNDKRAIMKEKMQIAGQYAAASKPSMPVAMGPTTKGTIRTTAFPDNPPPMPGANAPGTARVTDQPGLKTTPGLPVAGQTMPQAQGQSGNFADQVKALQKVEFQKQRADGLKLQREAQARFTKGETDGAIQILSEYLAKLKEAPLDPTDLALLQRPVEYRLQEFKVLKAQKDAEVTLTLRSSQVHKAHAEKALEESNKQKQVADLMKQFNKLYEEHKYEDAEVLAMKAHELDPGSDAPIFAQNMAKMAKRLKTAKDLKNEKEELVLGGLNDTDHVGKALTLENPLDFDVKRWKDIQNRKSGDGILNTRMRTQREQEIERKLSTPITVDFSNTPLSQVLKDLQGITRINVHTAVEALRDEQINPNTPVSLKVDAIPLKSALNILLRQAKLTYVIADDVLQVTTEKAARGKLVQKVYSVADLVIPIDNFSVPNSANLMKVLDNLNNNKPQIGTMATAYNPNFGMGNGQQVGQASMSTTPGGDKGLPGAAMGSPGPMASTASATFARNTLEDVLMKIITNTVSPQSWSEVGGAGQIDYFPIGMALVINQTPDVQEQVAELLEALRRLQDLEVAVEVRIVTVAETFFERIGLDFALNVKTDQYTRTFEPQLTSGQFKPAGYLNDPSPRGVIAGMTPAGSMTSDLDIPLRATSFNYAIPSFGYPNAPGANGGLSLGLAFLNDIQVFMFMEAAQGDRRTNVMFAPKLTLFNGQTSTIQISDFQWFVTSVSVISVNGQIVFSPNNTPFPVGTVAGTTGGPGINLAIQAVVSADRRYVRLNINPVLSSIASAIVPLFPVTTFVTPTFEGGFVGQPIPFTQFIQQPNLSSVNIQTTVSVPDGGTVLLGGMKSLMEGRNEYGPPVLSKIPYINRLVKNTGYGREAQSMMIMVTPRIIINSEESERQTGYQEYKQE